VVNCGHGAVENSARGASAIRSAGGKHEKHGTQQGAAYARPDPQLVALKVPPHSIEAEQSLLGALLLDNQAFDRVADLVAARTSTATTTGASGGTSRG
jgi:hypothetical protein